jgi:hypothetical protein
MGSASNARRLSLAEHDMAQSVHVTLAGHASNPARFHQHVEATLTHGADGSLQITYAVHGLTLDLRIPTPHAPAPADALWRTTCCEIFLGAVGKPDYREFNFSPSGQWAAYDFVDTRQRASEPVDSQAPMLASERSEDWLRLIATLPKSALPRGDTLRIALAVVLEANDGSLGYWALTHPPGKPDFHDHAGFVLSLGPLGFRPGKWP